jgi:GNAT superfamily N-acetyltransferase
MEIVEGAQLTGSQLDELKAGEAAPWGVDDLTWRRKEGFLALRVNGRLIASAGWVVADLEAGGDVFAVVGLGGVIVARPERGKGYARAILEPWLERARTLGPAHAALFCAPHNVGLYARFGFAVVDAPVSAEQPGGRTVDMAGELMWRPLRDGATWPAGPVRLLGLPF